MDRTVLSHIPVVVAVAETGGFVAAAGHLGISASAVSHAVKQVEERIGVPLFLRTTRSVALTSAGQALVARAAPALVEIAESIERLHAERGRVTGSLRLNVPTVAWPMVLRPLLPVVAERYPELQVEVFTDNALSDIVEGGFDAGIRVGEMIAQDMVAVRLTPPFRAITVASPGYIGRHGRPHGIDDLARHRCISYRLIRGGGLYRWELQADGRDIAVETRGPMIVSDPLLARDMAVGGAGLAYLFEPLVTRDLAEGRLIEVLNEHAIEEAGLFLYYPQGASMAPKLRAFIDTAMARRDAARKTANETFGTT